MMKCEDCIWGDQCPHDDVCGYFDNGDDYIESECCRDREAYMLDYFGYEDEYLDNFEGNEGGTI